MSFGGGASPGEARRPEEDEWVELVESGWALPLDPRSELSAERALGWRPAGYPEGVLGDGRAAERMAEAIVRALASET